MHWCGLMGNLKWEEALDHRQETVWSDKGDYLLTYHRILCFNVVLPTLKLYGNKAFKISPQYFQSKNRMKIWPLLLVKFVLEGIAAESPDRTERSKGDEMIRKSLPGSRTILSSGSIPCHKSRETKSYSIKFQFSSLPVTAMCFQFSTFRMRMFTVVPI